MQDKVDSLVSIFPDFEEVIGPLFVTNQEFRDLCTDYILIASKLIELKGNPVVNMEEIREYQSMHELLEKDIYRMLLAHVKVKKQNSDKSKPL